MKRALMLTVVASLAGTPALRAGAVSDWSLIAQNSIVVVGKKFPGEAAVYMGIVHAAIYDAAVGVSGGYRPYRVSCGVPRGASLDAAVATAAHRVLVELFPDQVDDLDRPMPRACWAFRRAAQGRRDRRRREGRHRLPRSPGDRRPGGHGALRPAPARPRGLRAHCERSPPRNEAPPGRAAGPGNGLPVPAQRPLAARQRKVRSRSKGGEKVRPRRQHGPDGGADAHGSLLDRPRHPAVEPQPASSGLAARPGSRADGSHAGDGARRGIATR